MSLYGGFMKKVAIVGYAPSWKDAPYQDKDTEIWIMNDLYDIVPRWDRLFDIHMIDEIKARKSRGEGNKLHYDMLKTLDKPIYMQEHYPNIPASIKFPLDMLAKKYQIPSMGDKIFLTCSVSHMIALAIDEGFKEIQLFGIHEAVDSEYKDEMPSVVYWLGYAAGKGINIVVSPDSPLLKGYYIYGYEEPEYTEFHRSLDKEAKRIEAIQQQAISQQQRFRDEENKCIGALTMLDHIKKITTA